MRDGYLRTQVELPEQPDRPRKESQCAGGLTLIQMSERLAEAECTPIRGLRDLSELGVWRALDWGWGRVSCT